MKSGLVSVLIPTYNRADTIVRAVRSALDQGYSPIEVVIVDDGSKDDTAQVVAAAFSAELADGRVRYLAKPNGGSVSARNFGLDHAEGEFCAMLDSDDYWLPNKLPRQMEIFARHPNVALVWSDMDAINPRDEVIVTRYLRKMYEAFRFYPEGKGLFDETQATADGTPYHLGDIRWQQMAGALVHTSSVVARTANLREAGYWSIDYSPCEDHEYYFRVLKTGKAALLDDVTIRYSVGTGDQVTTAGNSHRIAQGYLKVTTSILAREGANVHLPARIIRTSLGDGYAWAGQTLWAKGETALARRYLLRAVWTRPGNLYAIKQLVASWLPRGVATRLRELKA